ncbi:helix-turn-helix transcriptional regulator [Serratia marcescens]|uniref:helix-turn-helix transcriptional regulator n=1 Tax=Serratia marcescens TaxID=615 RepID=UPI00148D8BFB|nr:helix-turn-helix transcriptional regulator [Serratia marcescens]QJU39036.1 helix-turn-helix transcriptional regulator [Serratia marcescens]
MNNLREVREAASVSQTALAEMVGCSQGAIGHYEAGRRTPSLMMCRELVKALNTFGANVQVDDLFPPNSELTKEIITDA